MLANIFTVAELEPMCLGQALAEVLSVTEDEVDVAEQGGDQAERRWDSPVLCTYRFLPPGDVALYLDISIDDGRAAALVEAELSLVLAAQTGTSVLYPAPDLRNDSAYLVATVDGRQVRCRLQEVDTTDDPAYRVDVVETGVADLPRARVEIISEVLEHERLETPLSDAFLATYPNGTTASVEGRVHYCLWAWARLVCRLTNGQWGAAGRYHRALFRRDLEARDDLDQLVAQVGDRYAMGLRAVLTRLDNDFRDATEGGTCPETERWWWGRDANIPW
ncbi:hypothetical protein H7H51_07510 [Mycolicibacterium farcinogenes]|nr:hypothetical protein [Mycolicibacterium farcinogenes]